MRKLNEDYEEPFFDDVLEELEDDEFQIGQGYSGIPDRKIKCKLCNSDKWIVGMGEYHTSIKCPNCKYEVCIHEG